MPFLFRALTNKRRWDWATGEPQWLPEGEIPAAPFADFAASAESLLSMWSIADNESNLPRVVAALAASRQHSDKFDCALVEEEVLHGIGVQIENKSESCPDQEASDRWHRNLVHVTGSQLVALVRTVRDNGRIFRILAPDVKALLNEGLDSGRLDPAKMNEKLYASLRAERS